jgi:hypothetical protein
MLAHLYAMASLVAVLGLQTGVAGPARPDFTGRWTAIPGRVQPEHLRHTGTLTIIQTATTLLVRRTATTEESFPIDGSKLKRRAEYDAGAPVEVTISAEWLGGQLLITEAGGVRKAQTSYSLDKDGNLVITSTVTLLFQRGGKLTVDTIGPSTRVYKKD